MQFDFDQEIDRRRTGSLKWDRYQDTEILPLWVADMDFSSPPAVMEALHRRIDHTVFGYSRAHPGLVEVTVEYLNRVHRVDVDPSWIVWLPGWWWKH